MWRERKDRPSLTVPTSNGGEDEAHNYEDEVDFYTARRLSTNSFRWLWTANARADIRLKIAESSLIKERNRVQNAIDRQQRTLRSRSVVLKSLVQPCKEQHSKVKTKVGVSPLSLARPRCPTPGSAIHGNRRCELPRITSRRLETLRSRSDIDFSRHVTGTREPRPQQAADRRSSKLLSVDSVAQRPKKDYLQVPVPRYGKSSNFL